jgi:hypothetical protein
VIPKVAGSIPVSHPSNETVPSLMAGTVPHLGVCYFEVCHRVGTLVGDDVRMKHCPRCKISKPLDEFFRKAGRRASSYCKPCQLAYVREHYRRTSGAYNARRYALHAIYTERNRRIVLTHLATHPCIDCSERDIIVLDFDHVSGKKNGSISRLMRGGTAIRTLLAEMEKCVVRCANCHRRKTALENGSYRNRPWLYVNVADEKIAGDALCLWDGGGSNSRQMA